MIKIFLYPVLASSLLFAQDLPKVNEVFQNIVLKNVFINGYENETPKLVHITVSEGIVTAIAENFPQNNLGYVYDCDSAFIYPAFFDACALLKFTQQKDSAKFPPGNPTNQAAGILPEIHSSDYISENVKSFSKLTKNGFLKANLFLDGGLFSGNNSIAYLKSNGNLIHTSSGLLIRFKSARGVYPSSIIGMMAKIRQLFYDAMDYKQKKDAFISTNKEGAFTAIDPVMEELNDVLSGKKKVFFEANSESEILRALKLKEEFKFNCVIVGAREVHKVMNEIKSSGVPVIFSLNLPGTMIDEPDDSSKKTDLASLYLSKEDNFDLKKRYKESMDKIWNNISVLKENKIPFAVATMDVQTDSLKSYILNLKNYGLIEREIVEILSYNSSKLFGIENKFGKIEKGFTADFFLTDKKFFDKKSKVKSYFINGEKFDFESEDKK